MNSFQQFINPFLQKCKLITVDELMLEEYPSDYLKELLLNVTYHVNIYAEVLNSLELNKNIHETSLVDYGTGNGLLACFAKFCGFKKVIGVDYTTSFINAASKLSKALDFEIDFIEANENNFYKLIMERNVDVLVGTDVIEHIYNLNSFLENCKKINPQIQLVFTTASVSENYYKAQQLRKLQLNDEFKESKKNQSNHPYAGLSFLEMRKKIIQKSFSQIDNKEIQKLATSTRGLNEKDILLAVDNYINSKELPKTIQHPTNTCDPITGSWTERLLLIQEYQNMFLKYNFNLKIKNGFYNQWQFGIKNIGAKFFNYFIKLLGKKGIVISPFIILKTKNKI